MGRAEQLGNCIGASVHVGNANAVIMGLPGGNPEAALVVELEVVLELAGALDAGTSRLMVLSRAAMRSARGASEGGWPSPSAGVDVGGGGGGSEGEAIVFPNQSPRRASSSILVMRTCILQAGKHRAHACHARVYVCL